MSSTTRPLRRDRRAAERAAQREASRQDAGRRGHGRPASGGRSAPGLVAITLASLAAGVVLIAALLLLNRTPAVPTAELARGSAPAGIPTSGLVLGRPDAPVTLDLYEDFQCPACFRWGRDVFPTLTRNELSAGTVKIAFHGYAFLGPESVAAGRAAWAADRQGRFWDLWATLYANQGLHENAGAFARDRLVAMADLIGLDHDRFAADLDSPAAAAAVSEASQAAVAAGITSTPSLVIDGRLVETPGYAALSEAITAARP